MVKINEQNRQTRIHPMRLLYGLSETVDKKQAVGQSGQGIMMR